MTSQAAMAAKPVVSMSIELMLGVSTIYWSFCGIQENAKVGVLRAWLSSAVADANTNKLGQEAHVRDIVPSI